MHTDHHTPSHFTPSHFAGSGSAEGTGGEAPQQVALLMPVPSEEDVTGFITLYRERYGVQLEPARAHEVLGGLMRFLYLSRLGNHGAPRRAQTRTAPLD